MTEPTAKQEELQTTALSLQEQVSILKIDSDENFAIAQHLLKDIKSKQKDVEAIFGPTKAKAYAAYKEALDLYNRALGPLTDAEKSLKGGIGTYQDELDRKKEERRREAEAEARRVAEEERLNQAKELEDQGEGEAAEQLLTAPIATPKVTVAAAPKVKGVSTSKRWKAECFDLVALSNAVANWKAPINCIQPDMRVLNGLARSLHANMNVPGVRAVSENCVSTRV